jgi:hypothetical protein
LRICASIAPPHLSHPRTVTSGSGSAATAGGSDCDGRSGGHAELLFECIEQFLQLDDGHTGNGIEDVVLGESHGVLLLEM